MSTRTNPTTVVTASTVKAGDLFEFVAIPVAETEVLTSGRFAGMVKVTYTRGYDDTGSTWRLYPADYKALFAKA